MPDLPLLFDLVWDLLPLVVLVLLWLDWDAHRRIDDLEDELAARADARTDGGDER
jgi:hypothetical protein